MAVAQCLLDSGASCSEYTFDGERCYYVALTGEIRQLLLAYAQRWDSSCGGGTTSFHPAHFAPLHSSVSTKIGCQW